MTYLYSLSDYKLLKIFKECKTYRDRQLEIIVSFSNVDSNSDLDSKTNQNHRIKNITSIWHTVIEYCFINKNCELLKWMISKKFECHLKYTDGNSYSFGNLLPAMVSNLDGYWFYPFYIDYCKTIEDYQKRDKYCYPYYPELPGFDIVSFSELFYILKELEPIKFEKDYTYILARSYVFNNDFDLLLLKFSIAHLSIKLDDILYTLKSNYFDSNQSIELFSNKIFNFVTK